jgi:ribonuclease P protein component
VNKKHSFGKKERIKSKKVISALFDRTSPVNHSFLIYPYKVVYAIAEGETLEQLPQVLISVSKRKFKNATDRNTIKRRTKEAYRLNKLDFSGSISLAFIYVANDILEFFVLEKALKNVLARLEKETR